MSLMNLPMVARPTIGAMLGSRLTPSSAHIAIMAGLSMRRWALMNFSLKERISALGSAEGAGVCGERRARGNTHNRSRKVKRHAASMSVPPERLSYRNCGRNGRGLKEGRMRHWTPEWFTSRLGLWRGAKRTSRDLDRGEGKACASSGRLLRESRRRSGIQFCCLCPEWQEGERDGWKSLQRRDEERQAACGTK